MKIGILGGTFNPIHNGHLYMAFEAKETLGLDRIIFIPNYIPPHKAASDRNPDDVLQMLRLVVGERSDFEISSYEIDKKGLSYTYETLEYFTKTHPDDEFYFIIGEDSYVDFSAWRHPEIIIGLVKLVVLERKGFDRERGLKTREFFESHDYEPIRLDSLILEISSSDIRSRVRDKREIGYLVPREVREYIHEHELYP